MENNVLNKKEGIDRSMDKKEQEILDKINKVSGYNFSSFSKVSYGFTPLLYVFSSNVDKKINLSNEEINYIIKQSDLTINNIYNWTPFMYALLFNESQNLGLTEKQWTYLMDNCDLKLNNDLMFNLIEKNNFCFTGEYVFKILQQNDLKVLKDGYSPLIYVLYFNKVANLNLSEEQIVWIGERSDLSRIEKKYLTKYNHIKLLYEKEQITQSTQYTTNKTNIKI